MKIYINKPKEDWVVDRFVSEWKVHNSLINTNRLIDADIIWLIAPWTWKKISKRQLKIFIDKIKSNSTKIKISVVEDLSLAFPFEALIIVSSLGDIKYRDIELNLYALDIFKDSIIGMVIFDKNLNLNDY